MTRKERLIATLQGRTVDRPAVNFYEIGGTTLSAGTLGVNNDVTVANIGSGSATIKRDDKYT